MLISLHTHLYWCCQIVMGKTVAILEISAVTPNCNSSYCFLLSYTCKHRQKFPALLKYVLVEVVKKNSQPWMLYIFFNLDKIMTKQKVKEHSCSTPKSGDYFTESTCAIVSAVSGTSCFPSRHEASFSLERIIDNLWLI